MHDSSTFSLLNMAYREVHVGLNPRAMEIDSGEKRLNELGYKQELRREMVYDFFFFAKWEMVYDTLVICVFFILFYFLQKQI